MSTVHDILLKAVAFHQAGDLRQAEQWYRRALEVEPNHPHALCNLGVLLNQTERPDEGVVFLRQATTVQPDVPEMHSNLATVYLSGQNVPAAIAEFRRALELRPDSAPLRAQLAHALLEMGEMDEALALAQEAMRLVPGLPAAFGVLGQLAGHGLYTFSDDEVRQMRSILHAGRLTIENAITLHFALAGYFDRKGELDTAFRHYERANELQCEVYRGSRRAFDGQQHTAQIDTLITAFTPEFFSRARDGGPGFGSLDERPVFVVGMVRSGTSLVEQILSSHPRVFGCGELRNMSGVANAFNIACTQGLDTATANELAARYLRRLTRDCPAEALRVIDKMPHNYLHLGAIAVLFPHARVIHCRRDPMDTCLSAYLQPFNDVPYATSLGDLGFYYREYQRLMDHWRKVLPIRIREVVYEDLVADQERVIRELVASCGLEWDDRCLAFHANPRAVRTMSKLQVRQPIYTRSVGRWKRYEAHLGALKAALDGRP
jgi:Tfp pilus assembly protein PilF